VTNHYSFKSSVPFHAVVNSIPCSPLSLLKDQLLHMEAVLFVDYSPLCMQAALDDVVSTNTVVQPDMGIRATM